MTQTSLVRYWNASVYSTDSCLSRSATERQFSLCVTAVHVQNNAVRCCRDAGPSTSIADGPRDALCQSKSCQLYKQVVQQCTTNRSNGVRALQLTTCSKQPRLVDCRIGVVNKLDRPRRRRRVSLTTTRLTCRGEIFL